MADYQLYFLDRGGHIGGVVELSCDSDLEATQQAQDLSDGRAMELWSRERQVRRFAAEDASLDDRPGRIDPGPQRLDP